MANIVEVHETPPNVWIVKEDDDEIVFKYRSRVGAFKALMVLSIFASVVLFFLVLGSSKLVDGPYFITQFLISIGAVIVFVIFYSNSSVKIWVTKTELKVCGSTYALSRCRFRASDADDYGYRFLLDYGARKIELPYIWANGADVANFINRRIAKFLGHGSTERTGVRRPQRF